MFDEQGTAGRVWSDQFVEGTPVFDVDGQKVGTIGEHSVQGQYVIVRKGWLFPQDLYIPVTAIDRADAEGVYLRMTKDDISQQDWSAPPRVATMAATAPMDQAGTTTASTTLAGTTTEDDIRIPVREEELIASKQVQERGRVHLHKDVIEEEQTVNVPLMREEVTVERVPVTGDAPAIDADAFTEKDIEVPVLREEAVVEKRAHTTEEVRLHKDQVSENEQVTDTVRKERVVVDGAGAEDARGEVSLSTRAE